MVLIAAVDTGMFEMACNRSAMPNKSHHFPMRLNCDAWKPPTVGTLDHFDHLILANFGIWSGKANTTIEEEAVNLFRRSTFGGAYLDLPNISISEGLKYYE